MHLELDGHGPLHSQLTRALRARLTSDARGHGARLPSSRELARELGVSRNTVMAAYERLREEGLIHARAASGNFVSVETGPRPSADAPLPSVPPQSRYARRARELNQHAHMPPARPGEGLRYRFDSSTPLANPTLATAWARELARAAAYTRPLHAPTQGMPVLREAISEYLTRRRGVECSADDILIVAGVQQAVSLTARVLLDEGDPVAIEQPQYFAIRQVLQAHGAQVHGVPVDHEGLLVDALPSPAPRLVSVTPSHHFPTGATMSHARRAALLSYAERHACWIFEDDYEGEFRYEGRSPTALRASDGGRRVIYVGTFSKSLFPALRMGYIVMPRALREDYIAAKWLHDFSAPAIEQVALASFIAGGGFERHMRRSSRVLQQRRAALVAALRTHAGDRVEIAQSSAGMHVLAWLRGMSRAQGDAFLARAREAGIGIPSVATEYIEPPDRAGMVLKYAAISLQEIGEAVPMLARCLD
ncbi:MAG: PLP-dependent aminotransferase family protein [Lysobacter sp.]|nr:PLP-dependent aminotransferase family protein [Lysobacter sp.]